MPFFEPFKECFQSKDLVYGISNVRDYYAENYEYFKKSQTPDNISTIDQYIATSKQRDLSDVYYKDRPKPQNLDNFLQTLKAHHKYMSAYYSNQGYWLSCYKRFELDPKDIKRKCKAGLYWASKNHSNFSIHFLLDEIDFQLVIYKSHSDDINAGLKNYRAYVGSELRWIYRNRNDPGIQNAIQFWLKGKPCCPPWDREFDKIINKNVSQLWQLYKPRSL